MQRSLCAGIFQCGFKYSGFTVPCFFFIFFYYERAASPSRERYYQRLLVLTEFVQLCVRNERGRCCCFCPFVHQCQEASRYPLPRGPQCGCLSGVKSSRHFLTRGRYPSVGWFRRVYYSRAFFASEISARRPMANGFRAFDTPWLIENARGVPSRGGFTSSWIFDALSIESIIKDSKKDWHCNFSVITNITYRSFISLIRRYLISIWNIYILKNSLIDSSWENLDASLSDRDFFFSASA